MRALIVDASPAARLCQRATKKRDVDSKLRAVLAEVLRSVADNAGDAMHWRQSHFAT
jgi:hypothetical protein